MWNKSSLTLLNTSLNDILLLLIVQTTQKSISYDEQLKVITIDLKSLRILNVFIKINNVDVICTYSYLTFRKYMSNIFSGLLKINLAFPLVRLGRRFSFCIDDG